MGKWINYEDKKIINKQYEIVCDTVLIFEKEENGMNYLNGGEEV